MGSVTILATGIALDIDPENLIRMWKPVEADDADPTAIKLQDGVILVEESIRTILARFGNESRFSYYDDPRTKRPAVIALKEVAALTKASEDRNAEDDLTVIHLADGERLIARESIRTLSARLSIADIRNFDLDIVGTIRPACVVPEHVVSVEPTGRDDLPDDVVVTLRSGRTFLCRRDHELHNLASSVMKY